MDGENVEKPAIKRAVAAPGRRRAELERRIMEHEAGKRQVSRMLQELYEEWESTAG